VLAPDSVKVPAPALLKVKLVPLMMPPIVPAPLLITDKALFVARPMAAAVKVAVSMVRPVTVLPTVPLKVVLPVVLVDKVLAPLTVLLKVMAPPLLPVLMTVAAPKVTALV
jgi:hypothetical protein